MSISSSVLGLGVLKCLQPSSQLVAVTGREAGGREIWLTKAVDCIRDFSSAAGPWRARNTYYSPQTAAGSVCPWVGDTPARPPRRLAQRHASWAKSFLSATKREKTFGLRTTPGSPDSFQHTLVPAPRGRPGYPALRQCCRGPFTLRAIPSADPSSPRPQPAAPGGTAPHGAPAVPTAPGQRRPRPYGGDRSSFSSFSCLSSSSCSDHPGSRPLAPASRPYPAPPGPAGTEGAGAEGDALPSPRTAHGRGGRALAGLPLGCRAPWSRPPPLPC